jgi:hypothetical protein
MIAAMILQRREIVARLRVAGLKLERVAEQALGLRRRRVAAAHQEHGLAKIGLVIGVARCELGGAAKGLGRLGEPVRLAQGEAEPEPAFVIVRLAPQRLLERADHLIDVAAIGHVRAGSDVRRRDALVGPARDDPVADRADGDHRREDDRDQRRRRGAAGRSGACHKPPIIPSKKPTSSLASLTHSVRLPDAG